MAAAGSIVSVERVRSVTPSTRTEVSNMFLSTCDLVCRTYPYINRVLFYDVGDHGPSHYEAIVSMLEQSLRKTLELFYPLAGRLSHDEHGRLQIHCNNKGAELLEASIAPEVSFSDLLQDGFQYRPLFWDLAPKSNLLRSDYPHEPLLSIQVNSFSNGGLAIGVSMSHIVADAQSFYDFMRCWAETCRDGCVSVPPKHMRMALSVNALFLEEGDVCKAPKNVQPPLIEKEEQEEELRRPTSDLVQKVFPFSSEMLQKLKAKANVGGVVEFASKIQEEDMHASNKSLSLRASSRATFTTFESFCAHWWQSIIRAKCLPHDQPVFLLIPVNCRQRFLNLPKSYFGNSLDGALIKLTAGQLCVEELSATTARIHEAIVAATEERFKKYIKEAEEKTNTLFHFDRTQLFHIMDSPKFPIYNDDFGFGSPKAVRAEGLRYGCEVQILAGRAPGSFEFFCALDPQSMHRLEHASSFLSC